MCDRPHPFLFGSELRMTEKPSHVKCSVVCANVQPSQTITGMAQFSAEKVVILREERDAAYLVEHGNNFWVFDSPSRHVANLSERDVLLFQKRQLIFGKVFVQQVQATASSELFRAGRRTMRPESPSQVFSASFTASATAANGMRPPQRTLQMKSQERPSATSSNTCQTMIRVPLKVGLPWQISGSATM